MDWQDDEFETFLRQFKPTGPRRALPNRTSPVALAVAAVVLIAVAIPASPLWRGSAPDRSSQDPASDVAPSNDLKAAQPDQVPSSAVGLPVISPTPGGLQAGSASPPAAPVTRVGGRTDRLRAGVDVRPPRRIVNVNPVYPEEAKSAGVQGVVVLEVVIGEDGSVTEAMVVESIPELDQAAIDAVLQWQYETTLLNGQPVEVEMTVTINFTLH